MVNEEELAREIVARDLLLEAARATNHDKDWDKYREKRDRVSERGSLGEGDRTPRRGAG